MEVGNGARPAVADHREQMTAETAEPGRQDQGETERPKNATNNGLGRQGESGGPLGIDCRAIGWAGWRSGAGRMAWRGAPGASSLARDGIPLDTWQWLR